MGNTEVTKRDNMYTSKLIGQGLSLDIGFQLRECHFDGAGEGVFDPGSEKKI